MSREITSRTRRDRRRSASFELEGLERRELLAWSPLYRSLPDLTIEGIAAPVAAYDQPMAVTVDIRNLGASTLPQYDQQQGARSDADSPPGQVIVYASRLSHYNRARVVEVGRFDIPTIKENSLAEFTRTITLPSNTRGLPPAGDTVYLYFRVVTPGRPIPDFDPTNNLTRQGVPVQTAPGLPDLFGYTLDLPPLLQPGDSIVPRMQVVNYGTVDPATQGTFDVLLVASEDDTYGPGDVVLYQTTVTSLPPLSLVPQQTAVLGDVNVLTPINVITLQGTEAVTLPATPDQYIIGVVVDPDNRILEISEVGRGPDPALNPIQYVGPSIHGLRPAGVLSEPSDIANVFPTPPFGPIAPPNFTIPADPTDPVTGLPINQPDFVVRTGVGTFGKSTVRKRPTFQV